jgi:hypothetical protein
MTGPKTGGRSLGSCFIHGICLRCLRLYVSTLAVSKCRCFLDLNNHLLPASRLRCFLIFHSCGSYPWMAVDCPALRGGLPCRFFRRLVNAAFRTRGKAQACEHRPRGLSLASYASLCLISAYRTSSRTHPLRADRTLPPTAPGPRV